MSYSPTAFILSGINAHGAVIRELKNRGYHTVLIDGGDTPPAKAFADEHLKISIFDKDAIVEAARKRQHAIVVSVAAERANAIACYAQAKLGRFTPYSYETAMEISCKTTMKRAMLEHAIPTARFIKIPKGTKLADINLSFPVVVKPVDGYGSKGVQKVDTLQELPTALTQAFEISNATELIVEEYMPGKEISIYAILDKTQAHVILATERQHIQGQAGGVLQSFGSISPADITKEQSLQIQNICNSIMQAFHLKKTLLMIQAIVTPGGVSVLEFSPRLGGGLSFRIVVLQTQVDMVKYGVDSFLGADLDIQRNMQPYMIASNLIYTKHARFGKIKGAEKLLSENIIHEFYMNKVSGMEVGKDLTSASRLAQFVVLGKDRNELFEKVHIAFDRLQIYDTEGNDIKTPGFYMKPSM